jgi:hypothetical protein
MNVDFGANIIITIGWAILPYELVERQFIKLNKRFLKVKAMR